MGDFLGWTLTDTKGQGTQHFESETRFSDTTKPVYRSCTLYVLESFGKIMALFPFDLQTQTHGL